jgi:hypothetical protein
VRGGCSAAEPETTTVRSRPIAAARVFAKSALARLLSALGMRENQAQATDQVFERDIARSRQAAMQASARNEQGWSVSSLQGIAQPPSSPCAKITLRRPIILSSGT